MCIHPSPLPTTKFNNNRMKNLKLRPLITYFRNPLVEGKHPVKPAYSVPDHIVRPPYGQSPPIPEYGLYEGGPVVHGPEAISKLKKSASIVAKTLSAVQKYAKAGMTTDDIDKFVHDFVISQGAYPSPIGFMGFPKSVCTSVNQCLVHGIPDTRVLQEGDSVNVDCTAYHNGYHGDSNLMIEIGCVHPDIKRIIDTTQRAVYEAIKICAPGVKFNKIGETIERVVHQQNLHVCDMFNGHGIGHLMHMPPQVQPCYNPSYPYKMEVGNVFTIEPIVTMFPVVHGRISQWGDQFTMVSENNPNAQFEHMVLITESGYEVLTKREGERID